MRVKQVDENAKSYLKVSDFDNFFDVYEGLDGNNFYNLNSTVYLDISEKNIMQYVCDCICQWTILSYKVYGTTRLAWLLMKINDVRAEKMFDPIMPGQSVKIIDLEIAKNIVKSVNGYA